MRIFGSINKVTKQDDGTLLVEGVASSESQDSQKETITAKAMKAALPDYMKFANVREMHQPKAAGVAIECSVGDDGITVIKALVVDPVAIMKVETGVYKGFSIGGKVTSRDKVDKSIIDGIDLSEISLVDRPANPDAVFNCYKADGVADGIVGEDEEEIVKSEDAPVDEPEVTEPEVLKANLPDGTEVFMKRVDGKLVIIEDDILKGAYSISQLASLAESLEYFAASRSYDSAESPIPDEARKLAGKLYDMLLKMVDEDVSSAKQRIKDAGKLAAVDTEDLRKALVVDDIEVSDLEKGWVSKLRKALVDNDLVELVTSDGHAIFGKAESIGMIDQLVKAFASMPAPPRAHLINKAQDNGSVVELPNATGDARVDSVNLIKAAHQSGGHRIAG